MLRKNTIRETCRENDYNSKKKNSKSYDSRNNWKTGIQEIKNLQFKNHWKKNYSPRNIEMKITTEIHETIKKLEFKKHLKTYN